MYLYNCNVSVSAYAYASVAKSRNVNASKAIECSAVRVKVTNKDDQIKSKNERQKPIHEISSSMGEAVPGIAGLEVAVRPGSRPTAQTRRCAQLII